MKRTINNYLLPALAVAAMTFGACSDWTETESLKSDRNDISTQNPELYARYLAALRDYKKSDHKILFGWYDNRQVAGSQGHHLTALPDSVDIVALKNGDNLPQWITEEMRAVRDAKGTLCVYTISFPALEAAWAEANQPETVADGESEEPMQTFFADYMTKALAICNKYPYAGVQLYYPGRSMVAMSDSEKADYLARQQAFFSAVKSWQAANASKMIILEGNVQYVHDMDLLDLCRYIIIPTEDLSTLAAVNLAVSMALVEGVPTDRFLVGVRMTSLDSSDEETGYLDGKRALSELAYWTLVPSAKYTKAGVAVDNLERDYYYNDLSYKYTREALSIMNPAPKN